MKASRPGRRLVFKLRGRKAQLLNGPSDALSGAQLREYSDRNLAVNCNGFAKRLDALNLVHGLRREVRSGAVWTRPHRDTFYDKE